MPSWLLFKHACSDDKNKPMLCLDNRKILVS